MRFLRLFVQLFSLAGIVFLSIWISRSCGNSTEQAPPEAITNQTIVLQEITGLGRLELVRYSFKDIVEHERVKQWLPNPKAVLIVSGEAIGCIDLAKVKMSDIMQTPNDTLIVYLPEPELCLTKINHNQSRVYNVEYAVFEEAELVSEAYAKAEKQMEQSALQMGILNQTKENAEKMLKPLLDRISGKKVLLRYRMTEKIDVND